MEIPHDRMESKNKRRDNIFKLSNKIVIAFAAILALLVIVTALVLYQLNKTHTHLETIVDKNYHKTELLAQLKEYIRLRQIGLRDMMIVSDPFVKDEFKTEFYQYATNVALIREEFVSQNLSDEEILLTDKISASMRIAYPLQNALADKIIFSDNVEYLQKELRNTFLAQKVVMKHINTLEELIESKNVEALSSAIEFQSSSIILISSVGAIAFFIGIAISYTLIRINSNQEKLVRNTLEQLEHNNTNLEAIVSDRTSELESAKIKAESANDEKSMFLSRMSHELRTPLNAVLGFNQLMHEDANQPYLSEDDKRTYISNISKAGHHLLRLVNDVLDLSRIEQGKFELQVSEIDVNQSIIDSIELMKPIASENKIPIIYNNSCENLYSQLDKNRFEQIILNLISNAIKYNSKNGSINIYCVVNDKTITINIKDEGIGIPQKDIDIIFKPFNRLYLATVTNDGNGVGLSLSKHLIEEMGGSIGVVSNEGEGSTFWIKIDRCTANESIEHSPGISDHFESEISVLYIEDDADNITLLREINKTLPLKFTYHTAMTFSLATDLAAKNKFDYIMIDINNDNFNPEAIELIRSNKQNANTKIIGLSDDISSLSHRNKLYFNEVIGKPFNVESLRKVFTLHQKQ